MAWSCRAGYRCVYPDPRGRPVDEGGVFLYSIDSERVPARLFRLYRSRFQIEFAFRDVKQHLGLNDCQARSQDKRHFHGNRVFAALFWACRQARLQAEHPLGPFSLRYLKRSNFEE